MPGLKDTESLSTPSAHKNERSGSGDVGHKSNGQLFSGMQEYKRDPSSAAVHARRTSLQDQSAKPSGMLANIWNSTFKGADKK